MSRNLEADCIYFDHEDTSGWQRIALYQDGKCVEHYQFGVDYSDELSEWAEEMGESVPELTDAGIPWDTITTDNAGNQVLFRSTVRSATDEQLKRPVSFLDDFLSRRGAWLPGWDYLPDDQNGLAPRLRSSDLVRVDRLHFGASVERCF